MKTARQRAAARAFDVARERKRLQARQGDTPLRAFAAAIMARELHGGSRPASLIRFDALHEMAVAAGERGLLYDLVLAELQKATPAEKATAALRLHRRGA